MAACRSSYRRKLWLLSRRVFAKTARLTQELQSRPMIDYYTILSRAIEAADASDLAWRRNLYDRARRTLAREMQARHPRPSQAEITRELAALEAGIERIEAERGGNESADSDSSVAPAAADQSPLLEPWHRRRLVWITVALIVAFFGAGAYVLWPSQRPTPMASRLPANKPNMNFVLAGKDGDLPPGVDGGPMDADQFYVFRRQPTFYRTLQPVGSVIVDKSQHFLYLVQPNSMALRYGIGIGRQCADLIGLRRIAGMAEWPPWEAPPEMVKQRMARSGAVAGAPGNPLGARVLELDDNRSRIHGTNAPKTIGTNLAFGCIRLVNDDIVDLYGRVQVGTLVLVN
jgi:lipoprotein-anchoring transpeptidase ErfK/SrfK